MRQPSSLAAIALVFGLSLPVFCAAEAPAPQFPISDTVSDPLEQLATYLAQPPDKRMALKDQTFASSPLSKDQARAAAAKIWDDHLAQIRTSRKAEWDGKAITIGDKTLKFEFKVFGEKPVGGRSLFVSMHGGGGAPKQVNDQQWQNQIGLYKPKEGVYIAPRAPTDAWNMWHEAHMDGLFDRLIEDAVAFEDVNPDRVYIMGYSAGGDGVYQLGPRMADRWAAAAMMAGHPNDASPVNLRNLPFSIQCGGEDSAYNRNKICREWGEKLDKLREADPSGYEHQCIIYEGLPHWMNRKDAQAVDWMLDHTRAAAPKRIVWRQDDVLQQRLYWLKMPKDEIKAGVEVTASIDGQTIKVDSEKVKSITLLLNDDLIDLDKPVEVVFNGQKFSFSLLARTIGQIEESLGERADPRYLFPARVSVNLGPVKKDAAATGRRIALGRDLFDPGSAVLNPGGATKVGRVLDEHVLQANTAVRAEIFDGAPVLDVRESRRQKLFEDRAKALRSFLKKRDLTIAEVVRIKSTKSEDRFHHIDLVLLQDNPATQP